MKVGDSAPGRRIGPVTRTDVVRFAGAGGDFNPLHHDEEFARAAGMDGVFAMGQLQAGMLAGFTADWLGRENLRSYSVRFTGQVWPGDVLRLGGEVESVQEQDGVPLFECRIWVDRDDGERVVDGVALAAGRG